MIVIPRVVEAPLPGFGDESARAALGPSTRPTAVDSDGFKAPSEDLLDRIDCRRYGNGRHRLQFTATMLGLRSDAGSAEARVSGPLENA